MTVVKPPAPPVDFVDLAAELAAAFDQPRNGPVRAFFDRLTGEVESMPRDAEVEGVFDDIVSDPGRWIEITPLPLGDRQQVRARFVEERIGDPHLRLRLTEALAGAHALTRFDAVLRDQPGLVDEWLAFRSDALQPLVRAWLAALGIESGAD